MAAGRDAAAAPPLAWGAEALWEALLPLLPGLTVEVAASLPSTNSELLARLRGGAAEAPAEPALPDTAFALRRRSRESRAFDAPAASAAPDLAPCLLVAEQQTGGRGRLGRQWQSQRGASLTFSLALPYAPADWSGLSLAVGVALADALDASAGAPRIGLKWPNDLWLLDAASAAAGAPPGRKLGGILIETVAAAGRRFAVVGVGLNVLPVDVAEASSGSASLQELGAAVTAPQALARVAPALVRALLAFEREGFAPLAPRFAQRDLLRGREVNTTLAGVPRGLAVGVNDAGALLLDTPAGRRELVGGEVSVRLRTAATADADADAASAAARGEAAA